jgi:hypothetical protein
MLLTFQKGKTICGKTIKKPYLSLATLSWIEQSNDRKMKDRNTGLGIFEEMLTMEQREVVKIFLPYIFLSLPRFAGLVTLASLPGFLKH